MVYAPLWSVLIWYFSMTMVALAQYVVPFEGGDNFFSAEPEQPLGSSLSSEIVFVTDLQARQGNISVARNITGEEYRLHYGVGCYNVRDLQAGDAVKIRYFGVFPGYVTLMEVATAGTVSDCRIWKYSKIVKQGKKIEGAK